MKDFLLFNTFIAQKALVVFYYMFVVLIPVCCIVFRHYFLKLKIFRYFYDSAKGQYKKLPFKYKLLIVLMFIFMFFMFELFLRMFFEMLIGYFDMHDYLYKISQKMQS